LLASEAMLKRVRFRACMSTCAGSAAAGCSARAGRESSMPTHAPTPACRRAPRCRSSRLLQSYLPGATCRCLIAANCRVPPLPLLLSQDDLAKALTLDGEPMMRRPVRIQVAEPQRRDGFSDRRWACLLACLLANQCRTVCVCLHAGRAFAACCLLHVVALHASVCLVCACFPGSCTVAVGLAFLSKVTAC
jgi:hypothetical protein